MLDNIYDKVWTWNICGQTDLLKSFGIYKVQIWLTEENTGIVENIKSIK